MTKKHLLALCIIPVAASLMTWYATQPHRVGVSPDTQAFLNVAHHLQAGQGFSAYYPLYSDHSDPLGAWPPVFPALIWTGMPFGIHPLDTAWAVNLLLLAVNLWLAGWIVARSRRSVMAGLVIQALLALNTQWRGYFVWGISEPLFMLLVNLAILYMLKYIGSGRLNSLIWSAIAIGLSEVTRYIGGVYIPIFAGIVLLLGPGKLMERVNATARFTIIAMVVPVVWAVRNYLRLTHVSVSDGGSWADRVFGSLMHKEGVANGVLYNLSSALDACGVWISDAVKSHISQRTVWLILGVTILFGAWVVIKALWNGVTRPLSKDVSDDAEAILGLAAFLYTAGLVASLTFCAFVGGTPARYLMPTATHGLMLMIVVGHRVCFSRMPAMPWFRFVAVVCCGIWIAISGMDTYRWVGQTRLEGADATRGMRGRQARAYNWLPTEGRIREFRERKRDEDRSKGRSY
jgi:hypothetical protein